MTLGTPATMSADSQALSLKRTDSRVEEHDVVAQRVGGAAADAGDGIGRGGSPLDTGRVAGQIGEVLDVVVVDLGLADLEDRARCFLDRLLESIERGGGTCGQDGLVGGNVVDDDFVEQRRLLDRSPRG
ncbi:hypothetical protein Ga0100231_016210 [Opitutaceae bacterium TAV4]|nr:hypothetical protein Ga0100231_016210 [Opitutaceae bacterium TAV4]